MNKELREINKTLISILIVLFGIFVGIVIHVGFANAQTPPASTVGTMPDTVNIKKFLIPVTVESSIPWDQEWVGVYYRIEGTTGWLYVGACVLEFYFTAPLDNTTYQFATQVNDNNGNPELYPGDRPEPQEEAEVYVCTACTDPPDCPPPSIGVAVHTLAVAGITSWGTADEPKYRWWWFHSDCAECSAPVRYQAEWDVGGTIAVIDSIAAGDTTFAFVDVPVTPGQVQTLRVRAFDAEDHVSIFSEWGVPIDDRRPGQPPRPEKTLSW